MNTAIENTYTENTEAAELAQLRAQLAEATAAAEAARAEAARARAEAEATASAVVTLDSVEVLRGKGVKAADRARHAIENGASAPLVAQNDKATAAAIVGALADADTRRRAVSVTLAYAEKISGSDQIEAVIRAAIVTAGVSMGGYSIQKNGAGRVAFGEVARAAAAIRAEAAATKKKSGQPKHGKAAAARLEKAAAMLDSFGALCSEYKGQYESGLIGLDDLRCELAQIPRIGM